MTNLIFWLCFIWVYDCFLKKKNNFPLFFPYESNLSSVKKIWKIEINWTGRKKTFIILSPNKLLLFKSISSYSTLKLKAFPCYCNTLHNIEWLPNVLLNRWKYQGLFIIIFLSHIWMFSLFHHYKYSFKRQC